MESREQSTTQKTQTDINGYYNRAVSCYDQNRYIEALVNLDLVLQLNPDFIPAFIERGCIYYILAKREDASSDFAKVYNAAPDLLVNMGACMQLPANPKHNKFFSDALSIVPVIHFIRAYHEFFLAPFTNFREFQVWAQKNQTRITPLSEGLKLTLKSPDQLHAFKNALIEIAESDNIGPLAHFLKHPSSLSLVKFLHRHIQNPLISKWYSDQQQNHSKKSERRS